MAFKIALVQFDPARKDVQANIQKLQQLLQGLSASLFILPELSNTGYLYESPDKLIHYSEPNDGSGPFLSSLVALAKLTKGTIVSGYAELDGKTIFNSAAAVSSDGVIANYRKTHLFASEKTLFEPGDTGFKVLDCLGVKIGMMICFDWIFPESARTLALNGAQIIAHPANLVMPYCQNAMITRSIENRVFTVTANRIGKERLKGHHLTFTGQSQMTTPTGDLLYRGPKGKETVHIAQIDPSLALDKKISAENDLFEDRRSEFYSSCCETVI
jgi:predicted amidohydrolase